MSEHRASHDALRSLLALQALPPLPMALVRPCLRCLAAFQLAPARTFSSRSYDMVDLTRSAAQIQVPRPPKARSRRAAEVSARVLQVQSGLAGQEKRMADYKKTLPPKTSNRGLLYLCVSGAAVCVCGCWGAQGCAFLPTLWPPTLMASRLVSWGPWCAMALHLPTPHPSPSNATHFTHCRRIKKNSWES